MPTTLNPVNNDPGPQRYIPQRVRQGKALCLSGGGYRAALFHLGALTRLNELGVLAKIDTMVSVSGGSIMSAHLASRIRAWPENGPIPNWERDVAVPFRKFVKRDIRTGAVLKRLAPWNWFKAGTQAATLESVYRDHLTDLTLAQLPQRPRYVFCATDMAFGVNWIFERQRAGDYQAGFLGASDVANWPVARAVAASSCFPPVFDPLPMRLDPSRLTGGKAVGIERDDCVRALALTDGGVYDNMGLEPVWKDHEVVLVSDGGAPFRATSETGAVGQVLRYTDIIGQQAVALRKRWLIGNFVRREMAGTYWGIGGFTKDYDGTTVVGYSEALSKKISAIRTDMDMFSDDEAGVLENHGYTLAAAAIEVHAPDLVEGVPLPAKMPHGAWINEDAARTAIADSGRRDWFGRG